MALKGVSLAEREDFISKDDAAHPETLKAVADQRERQAEREGVQLDDVARENIRGEVAQEAGDPTIFHIGNLTKAERVEIGDMTATPTMKGDSVTMTMKRTERAYAIVQRGLKGWTNMQDHHGKNIPFRTETVSSGGKFYVGASDETLAHLSQTTISEIADAILEKNGMKEALEKNFDGASQQTEGQPSVNGDAPAAQNNNNGSEAVPHQQ